MLTDFVTLITFIIAISSPDNPNSVLYGGVDRHPRTPSPYSLSLIMYNCCNLDINKKP